VRDSLRETRGSRGGRKSDLRFFCEGRVGASYGEQAVLPGDRDEGKAMRGGKNGYAGHHQGLWGGRCAPLNEKGGGRVCGGRSRKT